MGWTALLCAMAATATAQPKEPKQQPPNAQQAPSGDRKTDSAAPAGLVPPKLTEFAEAPHPPGFEQQEAQVELLITIDAQGRVTDAQVVKSAGEAFDAAAQRAVRQFVFEPAKKDGQPVPARIGYRYIFEVRATEPPASQAAAQPAQGNLVVEVISNETGEPIPGARVALNGPENAQEAQTQEQQTQEADILQTGADGRTQWTELAAGTYALSIRAPGHAPWSATEQVTAGEQTTVRYVLSAPVDRDTFTAVATVDPPPREVTRRTLGKQEMLQVAGTRGDPLRAVELLPGVGRPPFGAGVLIVRGSAPNDSQAFLEGSPIPSVYHFGGLTSFANPRLLERIDFFPGNFSARYGRKIGGVLEVEFRDPRSDGLHGVADVNLIDTSLLMEGPISDNAQVAVSARRSYIDFWFEEVIPETAFDVVAAPVYWDYQAIGNWTPTSKDQLRLLVYGSSDKFSVVFSQPPEDDPSIRGNLDLRTQFHRAQLEWKRSLSASVDQEIMLSVGPTDLRFAAGEDLRFDATFIGIYGRAEWRARLTPGVQLIAGMDISLTPFDLAFRGPQPRQTEGNPTAAPLSSQDLQEVEASGTAYRPAAYVETALRPWDPLLVTMGLRLDWYRDIQKWSFDPRLVVAYDVNDQTRIKGGAGLFSQPPEFQESYPALGNPELKPIRAIHLGLGIERDLAEAIEVGIEGFYKQLFDRVVGTPAALPPRFTNQGIGRIYGLEMSGRIRPKGPFFGFFSYTLSRSERRDPGQPWRLFDFDQTHILSASGVYQLGRGWLVGTTLRLISGNPFTPVADSIYDVNADLYFPVYGRTNSDRNPLFHRLDLRVQKTWDFRPWKLAVYLDIQNVYNASNREGVIYSFDYSQSTDLNGLPIIPSLGVRAEL